MPAHQPLQPTGVSASSANASFISNLNFPDRSFLPELVTIYGNENYTFLLEALGKKEKVENRSFYHYESRGKLHSAIQVSGATTPASPTAGQSVTVTIASGSHTNAGADSPIRVGEVVQVSASGIQAKCTAVNKATANAHTATFAPLRTTDTFAPAANDWLLFMGVTEAGEASDRVDNIQNLVKKVTNTITEIREDFSITDKAGMERVEWSYGGQNYYRYMGTKIGEKRFMNNQEMKLVFGVNVTNTTASASSLGTLGLIPQIQSGGSDLAYTAGSLGITDFQGVTRQLDWNGAPAEIHHLADTYQYQELTRTLFAQFPNGSILWDSVGGDMAAAKYGFRSLAIENYTFHFKKYAPFSPEWMYGVAPATAPNYRNFGMLIPQGQQRDPKTGDIKPIISVVYQDIPNHGEYNIYETGGLSSSGNKTTKQELVNTFITHKGLRLVAANQCVILNG